eukprot:1587228-Rhodomonas_salina.1
MGYRGICRDRVLEEANLRIQSMTAMSLRVSPYGRGSMLLRLCALPGSAGTDAGVLVSGSAGTEAGYAGTRTWTSSYESSTKPGITYAIFPDACYDIP